MLRCGGGAVATGRGATTGSEVGLAGVARGSTIRFIKLRQSSGGGPGRIDGAGAAAGDGSVEGADG